jgi:hypothetical protein
MELGKGWKQWYVSFDFIITALEHLKEYGVKEYTIVYVPDNKAYSYCIFYYNEN